MSKIRDFFKTLKGGTPAGMVEGLAKGVTGVLADKLDDRRFTEEERARHEILLKEIEHEAAKLSMDLDLAIMKDRQSARGMYEDDSIVQKILSLGTLVVFLLMTSLMFTDVVSTFTEFQKNTFHIGYGIIGSRLGTVYDFFFGGSKPMPSPKGPA